MIEEKRLRMVRAGHAEVRQDEPCRWLLRVDPTHEGYSDAQIDDCHGVPRSRFPWRPPVRLSLRARVGPDLPLGTFGFGFWNDPFSLAMGQAGAGWRLPTLPRAIWFFYGSPPNDFAFIPGQPGSGWKAMSLESPRLPALLLAPAALAGFGLLQIPGLRTLAIRSALRMVTASEAPIPLVPGEWHDYVLHWKRDRSTFCVDGVPVLDAEFPPRSPLGFVAWIDNQFAVLSPRAGLRFGVIPTRTAQLLEIEHLRIESRDEQ